MVTLADIDCVRSVVSGRGSGSVTVEFGPWLGAISTEIANLTDLHVVDRFEWTRDHDRKVPNKIKPGDSFRPLFDEIVAEHSLKVTVHESTFDQFAWVDGQIDVVVIDAPKSAQMLKTCLKPIIMHLREDGQILLKHGLNPEHSDLATYVAKLIEEGVLKLTDQSVEASSTILRLGRGKQPERLELIDETDLAPIASDPFTDSVHLNPTHGFQFFMVISAALRADWPLALDELSKMTPNPKLIRKWDKFEAALLKSTADANGLAKFSEVVAIHHTRAPKSKLPLAFHTSGAIAQRGYWLNNAANPWRGRAYQPDLIARAYEFGYLGWPSKVREFVARKDILDVGCGPGLHGIGYIVAGAKSYLGLDPIVKPDVDRVKNLVARTKEPFGWTPNQISEIIAPWHVSPAAVGDIELVRRFDVATLHNVTEHLHDLENIFADIALRLRKGGKILYNHHNYYCWNGHHLPPKTIAQIDISDPAQLEMIDWGHVEYAPKPEHYIARGLNRVRLDEIIAITEKYFEVEVIEEIPSRADTGANRVSNEIRQRYPYLQDRDLLTQNLFCLATVRD